ncbi:MAG: aminotransferase class I/II-fold pyridoxal phosphate-dependent enzyme [Roseitalea sp.]|nr:aminotransferase class I/II-fold pyridoxal phosphate-dependent enzyme [Roseitalea sp.]MBO6721666.1 aminotransferase class I/II-fold pyridoxal phosphate-dependent enzyme [Roseitalea sp.]MBO6743546.1 aminotransferase class I/II-fold pyridoxal phosphate-dependent enzyme [Roseitalea sp.]
MKIDTFLLERSQTLYENEVEINLTESGVHHATMADLVPPDEMDAIRDLPLGYGYTDGTPALRQAVADWYPAASPENVLIANGTSEANMLALMSLADPGDHMVMLTPNFMQLDGLARALGVEVTRVPLRPDNGWQPDMDDVRAALRPSTRLVTLCDPNNPTGVLLRDERRRALAVLTEEAGVWLLVDEIYRGSEIDGRPPATAWGMGDKVIVTGGLAKSFGLPGLRMGWCIAPPDLVARMHERQDYTTIGTGPLAQELSRRALTDPVRDRLLARGRKILSTGRDRIEDWLRGRNGWSLVRPEASGMAFVAYDLDMESERFVHELRDRTGVFVCAGDWFGIPGHIRIGFGVHRPDLDTGLERIDAFAQSHAG